jgi:amino acid adenylation domain-containing protein/non-ribosomal peptide synthase protein (TIGR01720 family)
MKNVEEILPLSGMQHGILFHVLSAPGSDLYVEQAAWTIEGEFDPAAFERAWNAAIKRNSALRTCFFTEKLDHPVQVVRQKVALPLEQLDWREPGAVISGFEEEQRLRGFVLARAPLMRLASIRLANTTWRIIWTWHHLILDGWSVSLVLADVFAFYDAFRRGAPIDPPHRRPYRDYLAWLTTCDSARAEEYWRETLRGCEPEPGRAATSAQIGYGTRECTLTAAATGRVREFARANRITLNTMVQAAWALTLSLHAAKTDIVFGTVVSGRAGPLDGIESIVGLFLNTLPLRVVMLPDEDTISFLKRVQASHMEARGFEEASLASIQKWSGVPAGNRLFDSLLVFDNLPAVNHEASGSAGLTIRDFVHSSARTGYPLTLEAFPENELRVRLAFDTALYPASLAEQMLDHFETALSELGRGARRLDSLDLLTPAERHQILIEWNETSGLSAPPSPLHELIRQQAERTPEVIAAVCGPHRLKYRELDRWSDELAHGLQQLGAGPDILVGICAERSVDLIAWLLAILKAGAVYVPLDPSYPEERLRFMATNCGARLIVAQRQFFPLLSGVAAQLIAMEEKLQLSGGALFVPPEISGLHGAYAIFTSGSTGAPKAAVNTHAAIVNRLLWMQQQYKLTALDRVLQKTPISFDVSVWEFFWPLLAGARLVLAAPGAHRDSAAIKQLVIREGITTIHFVPSMLGAFLEEPGIEGCSTLRRVFASGEALNRELLTRFRQRINAKLYNLYGPTEASVDVTHWDCSQAADGATVPIGRPISNVNIRILDSHSRCVPTGVPGELYIGGVALARGYLHRPGLTAERFIPDPYAHQPGARLYRTGDKARYLENGAIEFLGRLDQQVKLRGFRIELGEIEAALRLHPEISDAVVLLDERGARPHLAAYYLADAGAVPTDQNLREFLSRRLPEYMLPSLFTRLMEWPLSPSGKLDRRALPAPVPNVSASPATSPRTPVEKLLAGIWAEVLRISDPDIHANFFDLGGDSILAMIVSAKCKRAELNISVRDVLERGTIEALAGLQTEAPDPAPVAHPQAVAHEAPVSPIQNWFFEHWGAQPNHFNQAIVLEIDPTAPAGLEHALEAAIRRHAALSMRFRCDGGEWKQSAGETVPDFRDVDLSAVSPASHNSLFRAAAERLQTSLDISSGRLLRAARFSFGPDRPSLLLLIIHHLAIDGVSWRILLDDLQSRGGNINASARGASFLEWAAGLEARANTTAVQAEAGWWIAATQHPANSLPRDFNRGPNTFGSARTISFSLSPVETRALLQQLPRKYQARVDEAAVSALVRVLSRWTGQSAIQLALETHGREASPDGLDVFQTVGWFTARFPARIELGGAQDPIAMLDTVKAQLRAIPDSGLGYGLLRYGKSPHRDVLESAPEPEVVFNYLGQFDATLSSSPHLRHSEIDPGPVRAADASRPHLIELNCGIQNDRFHCAWEFSENFHALATIEDLSTQFRNELQQIAAACDSPAVRGWTAADFPLAGLSGSELATVAAQCPDLEDVYRLSPIQEGLLFHHLSSPERDAYFEQRSFTIQGDLDTEALKESWRMVIDRHSILRTSFLWENLEHPVQVVRSAATLPVVELDWRGLAAAARPQRLEEFLAADRHKGFEFTHAPLLRLALVRMSIDTWVCVWTFHHLLMDGWSMLSGVGEVLQNYQGLSQGIRPRLKAAAQYGGYIAWLDQRSPGASESFWTGKLQGFESATPLPGPIKAGSDGQGEAKEKHVLPAGSTETLLQFARAHRATMNTVVQAAWALLLARWSGRDDVCFGATISCRPDTLAGAEEMVGLFINTVPVRTRLDGRESVAEWLQRLQAEQTEIIPHAAASLAKIQSWSGVPRGLPLFESVIVFQNHPRSLPMEICAGLEITGLEPLEKSTWPLMLVAEPGNELRLRLLYDHHRFDRTLVQRLMESLVGLLREIPADPHRAVGDLPSLTPAERHQALVEWNDTAAPFPKDICYHHMFEAQAGRVPDVLAVASPNERLTYGELNRRANQIARCLQNRGVEPEKTVAVCLERGADLVTARLAVMKSGAAYVPLDPALPPERLAFMAADAHAAALITVEHLRDRVAGFAGPVLFLDSGREEIARQESGNLDVRMSPDNLAYVIYTSGSTGGPKGVATAHAGFVNLVTWHNHAYRITLRDRKSQLAGLGFDASVWEMWPYLAAGASVHLPADEIRADWPKLLEWMNAERITMCFFPTPLAEAVIEQPWPEHFALRALLTGGDRLHEWPRQALRFDFVNKYGPTEVTAVTTWAPLPKTAERRAGPPSIGRPIANLQLYVLDSGLQPVPTGASGELYIGGIGLARCYYGRPDLTAERFVPNLFSFEPGARLYRTGDLVRWSQNGEIDFLGRIDTQVKIRGYRIEPGEIESALKADPQVRGAAVAARPDSAGGIRLIAYLIPLDPGGLDLDQLRKRLQQALPAYMAPSHFIVLDSFPLTPSGKVDYRALPDPAPDSQSEWDHVAPRTEIERSLARIWSQVLGVDRVGMNDNFFSLGGDSILSIRVSIAAAREGIEFSPAKLFVSPTVAQLAGQITLSALAARDPEPAPEAAVELSRREMDVLARAFSRR